ncbi:MAG: SBBP repeat-containing protein [Bacteroidota bacterium]|nr:SBBP repeat-containing protein [Bacteroidota bacterium]
MLINSLSLFSQKWEWLQTIRPGGNEYTWDITTDLRGNSIATGRVKATSTFGWPGGMSTPPWHSGGYTDAFVAKYKPNGALMWAKRDGGKYQDWGRAVTTDSLGNIYVTGEFRDTAKFGSITVYAVAPGSAAGNMYLAKYDSLGTCLWVAQAGNATQSTIGSGVTLDPAGNVYITGFVNGVSNFGGGLNAGMAGRHLTFVAKYSPSGVCTWVKWIPCTYYGNGSDIVYSKAGFLYTVGDFKGTMTINGTPYVGTGTTYQDIYTAKMDLSGNFIWVGLGKGSGTDLPSAIDVDKDDNAYITGKFETTLTFSPGNFVVSNGNNDAFLTKYDKNGVVKWAKALVGAGNDYSSDVEVFKDKDILIAGHLAIGPFTDGLGTYNCPGSLTFVARYDTLGNMTWYKLSGGTGINNAQGVATDTSGNLFVGGFFGTNLVMDTIVTTAPAVNGDDAYIAKMFPPLIPNISSTNPDICFGSSIQYNVTQPGSPITFNWSFPSGSPSSSTSANPLVSYSTPGIYNVQLITSNHHEKDTVFMTSYVTVNSFPVVSLGADADVCSGQSLLLNAGPGLSTYSWNDGSTSQSISAYTSGLYYVTGSNACGSDSDSISITQLPAPLLSLGPDSLLCPGQTALLDAGSGMSFYTWNGGQTTQTISISSAGLYDVIVTDTNGCSSADTIQLLSAVQPFVNIGTDTTICEGQMVLLNAAGGMSAYLWNDASSAQSLTATLNGIYYVDVTNASGCVARDSMQLTVLPAPLLDLGADTSICSGVTLILNAGTGSTSYTWNDASAGQTLTVFSAGQYYVSVSDGNGCTSSDTLLLSVNSLPVFDIGNDTSICSGQTISLNAGSGPSSYNWNTGAITQAIIVNNSGVYSVDIIDNNGCSGSDTVQVTVNTLPYVDLGTDTIFCQPGTIMLDAGSGLSTYFWNDGSTAQTLSAAVTGQYYVNVADINGCNNSDTIDIVADICLSIDEDLGSIITIYPNPATNKVILEMHEMQLLGQAYFRLYTVLGTEAIDPVLIDNLKTEIDISALKKGIYLYHLENSLMRVTGVLTVQ